MKINDSGIKLNQINPQRSVNTDRNILMEPRDEFMSVAGNGSVNDIEEIPKGLSSKLAAEAILGKKKVIPGVVTESNWEVMGSVYSSVDPVYDHKHQCTYVGIEDVPTTGRHNRHLTSVDNSGKVRWKYTDDEFNSGPAIDRDGNVYFCGRDCVVSLDHEGNKRWKVPVDRQYFSDHPPVVSPDGTVYVVSPSKDEKNGISCINAIKDGKIKWDYETTNGYDREDNSIVVNEKGQLFIQAKKKVIEKSSFFSIFDKEHSEKFFVSLDPSGKERFRLPVKSWGRKRQDGFGANQKGHITLNSKGQLLTIQENNRLIKYDADGKVLLDKVMEKQSNGMTYSISSLFSPETDDQGNIYVSAYRRNMGTVRGALVCLDSQGKEKWTVETDKELFTKPKFTPNGNIAVSSEDGHIHIYDKNGKQKKRFELGGEERVNRVEGRKSDSTILLCRSNLAFDDQGNMIVGTGEMLLSFDLNEEPFDNIREGSPQANNAEKPDGSGIYVDNKEKMVIIDGVALPIND